MHVCFDRERKKERDRQSMSEREREGGIWIDVVGGIYVQRA